MTECSPQVEDGYTPFANELVDAMTALDISATQWRIIMLIARNTYGYSRKVWDTANIEIANTLKIGRNKVCEHVKELLNRRILFVTENRYERRVSIGINKHYRQWASFPKTGTVPENGNDSFPKTGTVPIKQKTKSISSIPSPKRNGHIPYQDIMQAWNEVLGESLPQVNIKLTTDKRRTAISARWHTSENTKSVEWWKTFFEDYILQSDFLMGRVKPSPGRKQFKATFDWVFKSENFVKIVEGNYE